MKDKFMVCVRCFTYNHAPFIKETINGFVIQRTDFPFVCVIVDDDSTDGEQDVIKKYLYNHFDVYSTSGNITEETEDYSLIFARHKENINCFFAVYLLKYNHWGKKSKMGYISKYLNGSKYIALCEGDDYWISENKLQKQVDFMENHADYGLIHTMFQSYPLKRFGSKVPQKKEDNYFLEVLSGDYPIGTLTVLYRQSTYKSLPLLFIGKGFLRGDYPLWIEFAYYSKIKYLHDNTAMYRILENSASHSKDITKELLFYKKAIECKQFYANEFGINFQVDYKKYYDSCMKSAFKHKNNEIAKKILKEALQKKCLSKKSLLFYCATRVSLIRFAITLLYKL